MTEDAERDAVGIVSEFLQRYLEDVEGGTSRSLAEYQALFPGFETEIATAYADLERGTPTPGRAEVYAERAATLVAGRPARESQWLAPGSTLGSYRIGRLLGRGGQGAVFLATDTRLSRDVALKVLRDGPTAERAVQRLRQEAQLLAGLDGPSFCTVYESGWRDGLWFIAMQHVPGETLAATLARRSDDAATGDGPDWREDVALVATVAQALHRAHEIGVIHRDVKPSNLMLASDGPPVVLDLGLARDVESEVGLTATDEVLGTPVYMSPEQVRGQRTDRRTDVYSLGVTLYECLAGNPPHHAVTRAALYRQILEEEPRDLRRLRPDLPRDLAAVVATAIHKDPDRRYRQASGFAADLRAVLDRRSVTVKQVGPLRRAARWARRRPVHAALALVLALGLPLLAGLTGFLAASLDDIRTGESERLRRERESRLVDAFFELEKGEPGKAVDEFAALVRERPGDVEARAGQALTLLQVDRADEAIGVLRESPEPHEGLRWIEALALEVAGRTDELAASRSSLRRPTTAQGLHILGMLAIAEGHAGDDAAFRRALSLFTKAQLESDRDDPLYVFARAHAAGHCGDEEAARQSARIARRRWPHLPNSWFWAGYALQDVDRLEAIGCFREALERRQGVARYHRMLARCLGRTPAGDPAHDASVREAIEQWTRAHAIDPDQLSTHFNIAVAHARLDERDAATSWFERAIAAFPDESEPWRRLAHFSARWGRWDDAVRAYREAIALDPERASLWGGLGSALLETRQLTAAEKALRRAIALDPSGARHHLDLGITLEASDLAAAIASHRRAAELDPTLARAHLRIGLCLMASNDPDGALAAVHEAIDIDADHVEALHLASSIHWARGEAREGRRMLERAMAADPTHPAVHGLLDALLTAGRGAGLVEALRAAVEAAPGTHEIRHGLGRALALAGRWSEAESALRPLLEPRPDDPALLCDLGHVLTNLGRFDEAVDLLEKGHGRGAGSPARQRPSATWLDEARRLASYADELDVIVAGGALADDSRASGIAAAAVARGEWHVAARLLHEVLLRSPRSATRGRPTTRYRAAEAAAMAASLTRLDEAERTLWRERAADLLCDELEWLEENVSEDRLSAALRSWLHSPRLEPLRAPATDDFPQPARDRLATFWADVEELADDS